MNNYCEIQTKAERFLGTERNAEGNSSGRRKMTINGNVNLYKGMKNIQN